MPTFTATGITLMARKYGDTGRVVTFFTRERGKVEAAASGIGKPGSKLAAAVEPFTLSKLFFAEGRNLDRLTQVEVVEAYLPLRKDVELCAAASSLLELTNATTEAGERVEELFDSLQVSLEALAAGGDLDLVFWAFSLRVLSLHGCALDSSGCVECGGDLAGAVGYAAPLGGFLCRTCTPDSGGRVQVGGATLGALRSLVSLPPARLSRLKLAPDIRREIARVVGLHSEHHLGVRLKSREFLEKLRRSARLAEEGPSE